MTRFSFYFTSFLHKEIIGSNMNASIRAQHKHEPVIKAVRVNGQITEVKQPKANLMILMSLIRYFIHWINCINRVTEA